MRPAHSGALRRAALAVAALLSLIACRQDMHDQPKYEPLESSDFFDDGQASRPLVEGTVARGQLHEDEAIQSGKIGTAFVKALPMPVTRSLLERGRERYDIYCSPCHDTIGTGRGMIVRRGLRQPPSLHLDRLRTVNDGYLFDIMTNGFGAMPDYRAQTSVEDRWAIVAYIRALQLSQTVRVAELGEEDRRALETAAAPPAREGLQPQ
jgi:hypothetical protein